MTAASNVFENRLVDGTFRGGCLTTAGAAGSAAVVKGIWTATTAYAAGDIVVPHANMTGAGGKLLKCTTAGTSGSTDTLAVPNPGTTLADGSVTWTAIATMPALDQVYIALLTAAPSEAGGGTEVSGGGYARVAVPCTLAAFAGTQAPGSTTDSTGTTATTSNNASVTFPAPTASWGTATHFGVYDMPTGGNLLILGALAASKTVNNGDPAPVFPAGSLTIQMDN